MRIVKPNYMAKADQQQRQELIRKARFAEAVAVVMPESEANRKTREAGDARLPTLPGRIPGGRSEAQFAVISLRQDALDTIVGLPAGARAEFGGAVEQSEAGATWNAVGVLPGSDPSGEAIM